MEDSNLEIVVSAVDDTGPALDSVSTELAAVGDAAASMAEEVDASAESVGSAFTEMQVAGAGNTASFDASVAELNAGMAEIDAQAQTTAEAFDTAMAEMAASSAATAAGVDADAATEGESLGAGLTGVKSSATQLGVVAGLAFYGIADSIDDAVTNSLKWNETINELNKELANTGSSIPISQITAYAAQLSSQTLYSQQAVLSAENEVMSYSNLQGSYQQITAAAADLATKSGQSLPAAMGTLTKALADPITGVRQLQSAHIDLSAQVVKTVNDLAQGGATAAADAVLMAALNEQIGGLSETAAGASGAGLTKLYNDLNNMSIILGNALGPALDALARQMTPVVNEISEWIVVHPKLTADILLGAAALAGMVVIMAGAVIVVGSVAAAFAAFAESSIAVFIAAVVAVGVAVGALVLDVISDWGQIKDTIESVATEIEQFLQTWYNNIFGWIGNIMKGIQGIGSAIGGGISGAVGGVESFVTAHLATGGIVSSPTVALIGEAGPEAVIPLSMLGSGEAIGGGGSDSSQISVYITGAVYSTETQATTLGNMIARQINRQLKLSTVR